MTTGKQVKAGRKLLGWSHSVLARRVKRPRSMILLVEEFHGDLTAESRDLLRAMQEALEAEGVEFLADGGVAKPMSEGAGPVISAVQIKAARKLLGWSAATLAKRSGKSLLSVAQAEQGILRPRTAENILRTIQHAIKTAGVELTDDAPGVRLREAEAKS